MKLFVINTGQGINFGGFSTRGHAEKQTFVDAVNSKYPWVTIPTDKVLHTIECRTCGYILDEPEDREECDSKGHEIAPVTCFLVEIKLEKS